jgi:hypothetical protein
MKWSDFHLSFAAFRCFLLSEMSLKTVLKRILFWNNEQYKKCVYRCEDLFKFDLSLSILHFLPI